MKKNQKILLAVFITALALAVIALCMGFAPGITVYYKSAGEWDQVKHYNIYDLMFWERNSVFTNWGVLLFGWICLWLGIICMNIVLIMNLRKKTYQKLNLALTLSAIALLIISAMIMFFLCPIIRTSHLYNKYTRVILNAGSICWGILSVLSAGCLGATVLINKKLLKGAY